MPFLTPAGGGLAALADAFRGDQSAGEAAIDAGLIGGTTLASIIGSGVGAMAGSRRYRQAVMGGHGDTMQRAAQVLKTDPAALRGMLAGSAVGGLAAGVPAGLYMLNDNGQSAGA